MAGRSVLWAVLGLSLASCAGLKPRMGKPAMRDFSFRLREWKLPSGLRVLVEEDPASQAVAVVTVVGVGSASDPAGKEGLAHFVEHLAFRTRPDEKLPVMELLENSGASFINATTGWDETTYMTMGHPSTLPALLRVEGARLLAPARGIDAKVFDVEREVVRNELRLRSETSHFTRAVDSLQEVLFPPGHPYARSIGGTHQSLSAIQPEDVTSFVQSNYRLDNMTLVVSGVASLATVEQVLRDNLPPQLWHGSAAVAPGPRLPAQAVEAPESPPQSSIPEREGNTASPELYLAWALPRGYDEASVVQEFAKAAAMEVAVRAILDADVANLNFSLETGTRASMLLCRVILHEGDNIERTRTRVLDQLAKIWAYVYDDERLAAIDSRASQESMARTRGMAAVNLALESQSPLSRAVERASTTHFTGNPLMYGARQRALGKLTHAEIQGFAKKYLTRERARAVVIRPEKGGATKTSASPVPTPAPPNRSLAVSYPNEALVPLVSDGLPPGSNTFTLSNGLEVVVVPKRNIPVVSLVLGSVGGRTGAEPPGAPWLAQILARPRSHVEGSPEDVGGFWRMDISAAALTWRVGGASGNLPNFLAQLREYLGSMDVEAGVVDPMKKDLVPLERRLYDQPRSRAAREQLNALYPLHPLGVKVTPDELDAASERDAERFLEAQLAPERLVLVVAGDLDPLQAERLVRDELGDLERRNTQPPAWVTKVAPLPKKRTLHLEPRKVATQAEVGLGCRVSSEDLHDDAVNEIAAEIVSEHLGQLREKLGSTYGIGGGLVRYPGNLAHLSWGGAIEAGALPAALKELRETFESVTGSVDEQEFGKARWNLARLHAMDLITVQSASNRVLENRLLGRPYEGGAGRELAKVTPKEVVDRLDQCFGGLVLTVVGDKEQAGKALASAGWTTPSD